jgi:hypothetical protein
VPEECAVTRLLWPDAEAITIACTLYEGHPGRHRYWERGMEGAWVWSDDGDAEWVDGGD